MIKFKDVFSKAEKGFFKSMKSKYKRRQKTHKQKKIILFSMVSIK